MLRYLLGKTKEYEEEVYQFAKVSAMDHNVYNHSTLYKKVLGQVI
ncbi:MAG: hypothetical protein QW416_06945 [Candidatus Nitrosocaldaceae archaeon]